MAVSRTHKLGVLAVKMNIYRDYIKLNNIRFEEKNMFDVTVCSLVEVTEVSKKKLPPSSVSKNNQNSK
jgi:hypothetical protein